MNEEKKPPHKQKTPQNYLEADLEVVSFGHS